jgi:hypothetical protein
VDPDLLYALIPIFAVVVGGPTMVMLGVLLFPSTRAAFARRLAGRSAGGLDERAATQVESTDANVTALRSKVYALRCEVAAIARALPPATQGPSDSRAISAGR